MKRSLAMWVNLRDQSSVHFLHFSSEYPLIRWMERNGYDVKYISGKDTSNMSPSQLLKSKLFISSGHDEYWEGKQRSNIEQARDEGNLDLPQEMDTNLTFLTGLHLMFLSGNEVFWKIRWEESPTTPSPTVLSLSHTISLSFSLFVYLRFIL